MGIHRSAPGRTAGRRVAAGLVTAALVWLAALGPGCGSSEALSDSCTYACTQNVMLGCSPTCDCTKCGKAPASCDGAFSCAESATSCSALDACPPPSAADCAAFAATLCQ